MNGNGQASTALATVRSEAGLTMVVPPTEAEQRLRDLQEFVKRNMVEGEDYGVIPGTGGRDGERPKKTLLQPGAQKLGEIYGLAVTFEDTRPPIERWDGEDPMFGYFKRALVTRRVDGQFLGSGVGSCNSKEKKYAARWVFERDVPAHLDIEKLPKKEGVSKKNNRPYVQYRVPNPEIFDLVNTIEKMACKRALVAAMISVTRSAGIFTQDLEDIGAEPAKRAERGDVMEAEFEEPAPARKPAAPEPDAEIVNPLLARLKGADGATISAVWADATDNTEITAKGRIVVRSAAITQWTAIAVSIADCDGIAKLVKEQGFPPLLERRLLDALNAKAESLPAEDGEGEPADE